MRVRWSLVLIGLLLGACEPPLPSCVDTDCNCSDFSTQEEAQRVLDAFPNDPHRLDPNRDGEACESLPKTQNNDRTLTSGELSRLSSEPQVRFGYPSAASTENLDNYLLSRPQYSLSYNCDRGLPNWVSWQLTSEWLGQVERADRFIRDSELPEGCYKAKSSDYRNTGYDRGHLTPSADRAKSSEDNAKTFLMTNIMPQAPANNREVWRELEEHSRRLVEQGKELAIVAGPLGQLKTIAEGKIAVPQSTWKVILVLDGNLVEEAIAVQMPNDQTVAGTDWEDYRVSVDRVERDTGLDFFPLLPDRIERSIEQAAP